jgi:hypothetical protein
MKTILSQRRGGAEGFGFLIVHCQLSIVHWPIFTLTHMLRHGTKTDENNSQLSTNFHPNGHALIVLRTQKGMKISRRGAEAQSREKRNQQLTASSQFSS